MRVERHWLRELIFHGDHVRRFTQDSAILPDVWLSAGMFYCRDPRARVDLLLTPYQDHSPSVLAAALRQRLDALRDDEQGPSHHMRDIHTPKRGALRMDPAEQRRVLLKPAVSIAVNQTNVAAALTLEELIITALPLSAWWDRVLGPKSHTAPRQLREQAREQMRWLTKIVGVMVLCSQRESEPEKDIARQEEASAWLSLDETQRLRRASRSDAERFATIVKQEADHRRIFDRLVHQALAMAPPELRVAGEETPKGANPDLPLMWSVGLNRASFVTVSRSVPTTKADAARRLFDIKCDKLCWAIVDSGIDARHPAFRDRDGEEAESRVVRAYDFTQLRSLVSLDSTPSTGLGPNYRHGDTEASDRQAKRLRERLRSGRFLDWSALDSLLQIDQDDPARTPLNDHGTHVAGILAARPVDATSKIEGMCPDIRLCDLRVLDGNGRGDEFSVIAALQFIRYLNANSDRQIIHGVNISLSLIHDVENYACGRTPVCDECERLIASGVVVVVAAGNRGYETVLTSVGEQSGYRDISITDPGNTAGAITVGSTHRFEPHTYGVSYFSSRGPTGDGRVKPDVLAPGEKIESTVLAGGFGAKDGTSMAAPHVSGLAALLMARHSEFMGQPARIKEIICRSATDLGREKYFQGAGVIDTLRALQSV
ncbi:MAG TPA: S8 family peptidase [Steroidobacteraceae bacterium]|nr:S8 family peptidase [Steroidobacteraceae bacterium]